MITGSLRAAAGMLLFLLSNAALAEDTNFTTSHFSGSGNCAMCHDGLTDTAGENVSIVRDWGSSMMANSAKDPFWRAKVATELERNSSLAPVIKDKCTQCHAPMANYESDGKTEILGEKGLLDSSHPLHDAAMNGVSCTYCHQIENTASLGTLEGFSGEVEISDDKVTFGQYSDPLQQPMINQVGFTPLYGEHMSDSRLCASCHNLKTPFVDANGNLASSTPESEFPEQMPYTEWENSIFSDTGSNPTSCQECHMPVTSSKISTRPSTLPVRENFAKHRFSGANTVMLTLLRDNAVALDVDVTSIDANITRSREMLQNAGYRTFGAVNNSQVGALTGLARGHQSFHEVWRGIKSKNVVERGVRFLVRRFQDWRGLLIGTNSDTSFLF